MRTCQKCGCYIPDNWITCPACDARVSSVFKEKKTEWNPWRDGTRYTEEILFENIDLEAYRVDVLYDCESVKTREYFGQYESAHAYASRMVVKNDVYAVQIIYKGRIVETMMT